MFSVTGGTSIRRAKAVCANCPVQSECLAFALEEPLTSGVWGGTSQKDPKDIGRRAA
jgi:WhiB family redox-sensing transcriptional regulator